MMKQLKSLMLLLLVTASLNCAPTQEEVDMLIARATAAREKAYCPYSKFQVGAAVLTTYG